MTHAPIDDATLRALLRRVAARDEAALSELFDRSAGAVRGVAERIVKDPTLADEAVLDVFLHVWNRADDYRGDRGSVATWLVLLARSRSIDVLRRRGRQTKLEVGLPQASVASLESDDLEPAAAGERDDRGARVRAALERIAPEERRAVWSAFFLGLSHSEIAERLAQPLGTVKTRIRSGLAKLERLLTPLETRA